MANYPEFEFPKFDFPDIDTDKAYEQAEKMMALPIGMASPFWMAYSGAAAAGMTYWAMAQAMKPMHLEKFYDGKIPDFAGMMPDFGEMPTFANFPEMMAALQPEPSAPPTAKAKAKPSSATAKEVEAAPVIATVEPMLEAAEAVMETAVEVTEAFVEDMTEASEAVMEATEEAAETLEAPAAPLEPEDLTVLTGIGPTLASKLADLGVTRFEHIAAWTEEDIKKFDKELKLMGRVARENWIDQAKQLAEA